MKYADELARDAGYGPLYTGKKFICGLEYVDQEWVAF